MFEYRSKRRRLVVALPLTDGLNCVVTTWGLRSPNSHRDRGRGGQQPMVGERQRVRQSTLGPLSPIRGLGGLTIITFGYCHEH